MQIFIAFLSLAWASPSCTLWAEVSFCCRHDSLTELHRAISHITCRIDTIMSTFWCLSIFYTPFFIGSTPRWLISSVQRYRSYGYKYALSRYNSSIFRGHRFDRKLTIYFCYFSIVDDFHIRLFWDFFTQISLPWPCLFEQGFWLDLHRCEIESFCKWRTSSNHDDISPSKNSHHK